MIAIRDIKKTFGSKEVLKGVSGTFEKGKTSLIIGASGTGKSILLKCMVGIFKPDSGIVLYDDRNFTKGNVEERQDIRKEVGMLFQSSALFDSMTVEQNVMFPLNMLTKMGKSEKLDRVNECLKRVGLENANKLKPSEISGGMQKRVGIARAIVNNSKYLFCDEPNSGLDPQTSVLIDNLIKDITDEYQTTTVVVTHDMNSVLGIGEHIIFLYKGDKLWEGNSSNILDSPVQELQDFIQANKLVRELKNNRLK